MKPTRAWPVRVAVGHSRTVISLVGGVVAYLLLPNSLGINIRSVVTWDIGALVLLLLAAVLFTREGDNAGMEENARQQQDGEWTMFWVTLASVAFSFVALTSLLAGAKEIPPFARSLRVGLVAITLLISWLTTHLSFAIRYAHEYYTISRGQVTIGQGLVFPGDTTPDYWDFAYFSFLLGMTFQVMCRSSRGSCEGFDRARFDWSSVQHNHRGQNRGQPAVRVTPCRPDAR